MKKLHLITAAAITLAGAATTVGVTYAATNVTGDQPNPMHTLVTAIATKFNLSETDVQQVFEDQRAQMEAEHQQAEADRLAQAVTDGKLTQAQADLITAKLAELKANRPDLSSATPAERQSTMKEHFDELKQWATDNNIPMGGPDHHRRPGFFNQAVPADNN